MNDKLRQVSQRIVELREILELSRAEVAQKSGLTLADYTAYETAEADMPISALYAVATVLGVDPTVLLTGEGPKMQTYTLVRQGKGATVERYKEYVFTSLAFNYIGREMEPMIVTLEQKERPPHLVTHKGQEFNLVLEGSIAVLIDQHRFVLNAGDSIYFDPTHPHGQESVSPVSKFLTVINETSTRL